MKKISNRQGVALLLLAALLLLLSGCGTAEVTALDTVEVETHQETVVLDEAAQLTAEVRYPVVSAGSDDAKAAKVVETLNAQFQQDAEQFVAQAKTVDLSAAQPGQVFDYVAEVRYNAQGMLSVVQCETYGEIQYLQYAATYDLGSGKKMSMGEIMDMKEAKAEETVAKMFCGVVQSDPNTFNADAEDYIQANLDRVQFYRCDEGLGVFFQAGAIAPASAGILEMVMQ